VESELAANLAMRLLALWPSRFSCNDKSNPWHLGIR